MDVNLPRGTFKFNTYDEVKRLSVLLSDLKKQVFDGRITMVAEFDKKFHEGEIVLKDGEVLSAIYDDKIGDAALSEMILNSKLHNGTIDVYRYSNPELDFAVEIVTNLKALLTEVEIAKTLKIEEIDSSEKPDTVEETEIIDEIEEPEIDENTIEPEIDENTIEPEIDEKTIEPEIDENIGETGNELGFAVESHEINYEFPEKNRPSIFFKLPEIEYNVYEDKNTKKGYFGFNQTLKNLSDFTANIDIEIEHDNGIENYTLTLTPSSTDKFRFETQIENLKTEIKFRALSDSVLLDEKKIIIDNNENISSIAEGIAKDILKDEFEHADEHGEIHHNTPFAKEIVSVIGLDFIKKVKKMPKINSKKKDH